MKTLITIIIILAIILFLVIAALITILTIASGRASRKEDEMFEQDKCTGENK